MKLITILSMQHLDNNKILMILYSFIILNCIYLVVIGSNIVGLQLLFSFYFMYTLYNKSILVKSIGYYLQVAIAIIIGCIVLYLIIELPLTYELDTRFILMEIGFIVYLILSIGICILYYLHLKMAKRQDLTTITRHDVVDSLTSGVAMEINQIGSIK